MNTFKTDLNQSRQDFLDVVWPAIKDECGGGEILPVEDIVQERFAAVLDRLSGIDYWQKRDDGLRGIAARIQYGCQPWATFTIRATRASGAMTEWEKRREAYKAGMLLPALTVQAYLSGPGGRLMARAIVRTSDLIRFMENDAERGRDYLVQQNGQDGNTFYAVWWDSLKAAGLTVGTYSLPGITLHSKW